MSHSIPSFVPSLLPHAPGLQVRAATLTEHELCVELVTTARSAPCPLCDQPSVRVHSRYQRTVADLPWAGRPVRLRLQVRKFFCHTPTCPRRVFTERLPAVVAPAARTTSRLTDLLRLLGFAVGGEAGTRFGRRLGLRASPRTLLRLLRRTPCAAHSTPRVLGIDDWSFRRRQAGTILVDLEQQTPVDLLPESTETAVATWLQTHPGVAIISRDRGEVYAKGATAGAPAALQVADRWHLLKNCGDAFQKFLAHHAGALRQAAREVGGHDVLAVTGPVPPPPPPQRPARPLTPRPLTVQQTWQRATYVRVRDLAAAGWSVQAIARELKIERQTARKYRDMDPFRDGRTTARPSSVEPYRAYLEDRWAAGGTQARQLWDEVRAQGYRGPYKSVWNFLRNWPPPVLPAAAPLPAPLVQAARTPRQAKWLLLQAAEERTVADRAYGAALCHICPEIGRAATLVQAFGRVVRERDVVGLDRWLAAAEGSGLREVRRFALGLRQDEAAVRAALTQPWSQGQVEGQITRVKLLKRMMYGRANFDLLRLRVLHTV
jgi:transposase